MDAAKRYPRIAQDIDRMATYLPGSEIHNYTLKAPASRANPLCIYSRSTTVEDATQLMDLLEPGMGNCVWAACTELRKK